MKKIFLLLMILSMSASIIRAQDQFIKLLVPDLYLIHKHTYGMDSSHIIYSTNNYNYSLIRAAGINHLFSTSDDTSIIQGTADPSLRMKIYDRKLSESKPNLDTAYLTGYYGFGIGVSPKDHPYTVAGQNSATLINKIGNWGFGNNNLKSRWNITTGLVGSDELYDSRYHRESTQYGYMCGIVTDPEHFYLHTTGGPQTSANLPIHYFPGLTVCIDSMNANLTADSVVLELHFFSEKYTGKSYNPLQRNISFETTESPDTCTSAIIYLRKRDIPDTNIANNFVMLLPEDAYLRHPKSVDGKLEYWKIHLNAKSLGNCRVRIRNLFITDQFYKDFVFYEDTLLYSRIKVDLDTIVKQVDNYAGLYVEEPIALMNKSIHKLDSLAFSHRGKRTDAMDWFKYRYEWEMIRSDWTKRTVQADGYFIKDNVDSASNSASGGKITMQAAIDARIYTEANRGGEITYTGLRANIEAANGFSYYPQVPNINYIQIGQERRINDSTNVDDFKNRNVHPSEIQMQGWLSLCFGAKGIAYYPSAYRDDISGKYRNL